jgi:hypothetical protein
MLNKIADDIIYGGKMQILPDLYFSDACADRKEDPAADGDGRVLI